MISLSLSKSLHFRVSLLGAMMAAVLAGACVRSATAQPATPVFVHATSAPVTVAPGATATVVLKINIDKDYHLQGNNAKDPYVPTTVTLTAPTGVTIGKIVYPPSIRKQFSGETLPIYEGAATIKITMTVGAKVKPGTINIPVAINYQGCNNTSCYPPTKMTAAVTITVK